MASDSILESAAQAKPAATFSISEGDVRVELRPYQRNTDGPTRYSLIVPSEIPEGRIGQLKKNIRAAERWLNGDA